VLLTQTILNFKIIFPSLRCTWLSNKITLETATSSRHRTQLPLSIARLILWDNNSPFTISWINIFQVYWSRITFIQLVIVSCWLMMSYLLLVLKCHWMIYLMRILLTHIIIIFIKLQMMTFINLWCVMKHLFFISNFRVCKMNAILGFLKKLLINHGLMDSTVHNVVSIVTDGSVSTLS